jgi:DNA (cytosine-5)-methyltransferase 1
MIENVKGLMSRRFDSYREEIAGEIEALGLKVVMWDVVEASSYGVPQRRPRSLLIALKPDAADRFQIPAQVECVTTVADTLLPYLQHWKHRDLWAKQAAEVAPTLVGGSRKHGGADLGPTGAKRAWARLGVNAHLVAQDGPDPDHVGPITLTVEHAAAIQVFPADWEFVGGKTARYRQVGNAFPPPVARAFGVAIANALRATT